MFKGDIISDALFSRLWERLNVILMLHMSVRANEDFLGVVRIVKNGEKKIAHLDF